jgi:hypothetical protein
MDKKAQLEGEIAKLAEEEAEESRLALIADKEKAEKVAEERGPDVKAQPVYNPDAEAPAEPMKKARRGNVWKAPKR